MQTIPKLFCIGFILILFQILTREKITLFGWRTPLSWGLVKDIIDIILTILVVWGLWPALIISIYVFSRRISMSVRVTAIFFFATLHGALSATVYFEKSTISRTLIGIATFNSLYFLVFVVSAPLIIFIAEKVRNKNA